MLCKFLVSSKLSCSLSECFKFIKASLFVDVLLESIILLLSLLFLLIWLKFLILEKFINCFLEIGAWWMALEDNGAFFVEKQHVWHTSSLVLFHEFRLASMVVNDTVPLLIINMRDKLIHGLINTESENLDLTSPIRSLLQHFLVVSHWPLARWAPSGPEINKPYFSLLVDEVSLVGFLLLEWYKTSDSFVFGTNESAFDLELNIWEVTDQWLHLFIELFDIISYLRLELFSNS